MLTRQSGGLVTILTNEGSELLHYFTTNHLQQLVNEQTYLVGDNKSCIDLVLTDQPNLVINCVTIPSLHTNCHHQGGPYPKRFLTMILLILYHMMTPPLNQTHPLGLQKTFLGLIKRYMRSYKSNIRNGCNPEMTQHIFSGKYQLGVFTHAISKPF